VAALPLGLGPLGDTDCPPKWIGNQSHAPLPDVWGGRNQDGASAFSDPVEGLGEIRDPHVMQPGRRQIVEVVFYDPRPGVATAEETALDSSAVFVEKLDLIAA
jgi:hypothetical protein